MTAHITIPTKLDNLLKENQALHGGVIATLASFGELLNNAEMTFFPEYSDHSHVHVKDVLNTIELLIPRRVWESNLLTSGDAATLILAVLIHDSAMKLTEEGFLHLCGGNWDKNIDDRFSDKPWSILWDEFIREASRFDGRKLISLFGSMEQIQRPANSPDKWTKRDRLLIGEFLRRHHHRLAHEFALHGFPGAKETLKFNESIPELIEDLAGIIARSHGMDLRSCIDTALNSSERPVCNGVHVPYLMGLLRISDYIQIHPDRISLVMWNLRNFQSTISKAEWEKHLRTYPSRPLARQVTIPRAKCNMAR